MLGLTRYHSPKSTDLLLLLLTRVDQMGRRLADRLTDGGVCQVIPFVLAWSLTLEDNVLLLNEWVGEEQGGSRLIVHMLAWKGVAFVTRAFVQQ